MEVSLGLGTEKDVETTANTQFLMTGALIRPPGGRFGHRAFMFGSWSSQSAFLNLDSLENESN